MSRDSEDAVTGKDATGQRVEMNPSAATAHSRLTAITYPSGYVLIFNYSSGSNDIISRFSSLSDSSGTLESSDYRGLGTVIRYVKRNALRANLMRRAEAWPWGSLAPERESYLHRGPCLRGEEWQAYVNRPQSEAELKALRQSGSRGTPFGGSRWQRVTVSRLGLESTLRPRGRPKKKTSKKVVRPLFLTLPHQAWRFERTSFRPET